MPIEECLLPGATIQDHRVRQHSELARARAADVATVTAELSKVRQAISEADQKCEAAAQVFREATATAAALRNTEANLRRGLDHRSRDRDRTLRSLADPRIVGLIGWLDEERAALPKRVVMTTVVDRRGGAGRAQSFASSSNMGKVTELLDVIIAARGAAETLMLEDARDVERRLSEIKGRVLAAIAAAEE